MEYTFDILRHAPEDLVFLDETSVELHMIPTYGRSPRGIRAWGTQYTKKREKYSLIGVVTSNGFQAPMITSGSIDTSAFKVYLNEFLLPTIKPGQVLVMDNYSVHKSKEIQEYLLSKQIPVLYLPPYSPHLNPIELTWSKLKGFLRASKATTYKKLIKSLKIGFNQIKPSDCRNWFKHCGIMV